MDTEVVETIGAAELKRLLDDGTPLRLVNALGEWEFRAKHIPGSIRFATVDQALEELDPQDEIVVYCTNPPCVASLLLYHYLRRHGYRHVRRFAGGLDAWEAAGFPLEGDAVV